MTMCNDGFEGSVLHLGSPSDGSSSWGVGAKVIAIVAGAGWSIGISSCYLRLKVGDQKRNIKGQRQFLLIIVHSSGGQGFKKKTLRTQGKEPLLA